MHSRAQFEPSKCWIKTIPLRRKQLVYSYRKLTVRFNVSPVMSHTMNYDVICEFCIKQPGATRDIKWQSKEVFSVGGKMFCLVNVVPTPAGISIKADPTRFLELTDQPGISPAPYLARYHWVTLESPQVVPAAALIDLLRESYQWVWAKLPKKIRDDLIGGNT